MGGASDDYLTCCTEVRRAGEEERSPEDAESFTAQQASVRCPGDLIPPLPMKSPSAFSTMASSTVEEGCPAKPEKEDVLEELDTFFRQVSMLSSFTAATSKPQSDMMFAEASQTLIIFDWDDTLFPTTELLDRWGLPPDPSSIDDEWLTLEQQRLLSNWRQALKEYLEQACALSDTCLIITNSRRPWVSNCIERFAPELQSLFERPHNAPQVVYADERLKSTRTFRSQCMDLRPVKFRQNVLMRMTSEETTEECTMAKYAAMKAEAKKFYSKYPGQSWKNILSIGDMRYERDALQELSFKRVPQGREKLRTKTLVLPSGASLSEITLRLQFSTIMLPAYVRYDGNFDLDLQESSDPLRTIAEGLNMPELASLSFSRHAWGREAPPKTEDDKQDSLANLAVCVHETLFS